MKRLAEAEKTIEALRAGQGGAAADGAGTTPELLAKAQEALRASEEQYRQIVEATSDGIMKIDGAARIVFVNRRFAEMLGYEAREMIGLDERSFMNAAAREIAAQGPQMTEAVDTTFRHKNGTDISVNVAASRLLDESGAHVGDLKVVRDVTERKKLMSQLMVSDRMASVGTLAAGVAHEINNPLAAVIANLDFLVESQGAAGDEPATAELKGPLRDARDAAERIRLIVRDLKDYSRSPGDEPRGAVDVEAIMESSLRMADNEIRHRARVVRQYGPVPGVAANEARLGQVFLNLLVNAAQAITDGRAEHNEIRVSTRLDGGRVVVEVGDTGAGIPPAIIGRIFDAFFTTKAVGVGTGIGLAICQRIVTDMDGDLTVESEVGRGSTFRVTLPVGADQRPAVVPPPAELALPGRRGRILVVDDEPLVLRAVRRTLDKEHEVVTLAAAQEALALCAGGETFDLILCDLMMPDMTGMELYRELSRVAKAQADKMVFLTGGAFTAEGRQFLAETDREHLEKPFRPALLRATIQRYLR